jgi:hypothetical protein
VLEAFLKESFFEESFVGRAVLTPTDRTPLLAVSRTGATTGDVIVLSPDDLLAAWDAPR